MSKDSWFYYRDFRHSDRPEDWLPARYKRKARRVKGKRVCGRDKTRPCEFTINVKTWSYRFPDGTMIYYVNACPKCGRHGFKPERVFITNSRFV